MSLTNEDLQKIGQIVQPEFQKLGMRISALESGQATITAELKSVKQDVAEVKQDVASLKQDVDNLKQDVVVIKYDFSILKQDVGEIKVDIREIKADIAEFKHDNELEHDYLQASINQSFGEVSKSLGKGVVICF